MLFFRLGTYVTSNTYNNLEVKSNNLEVMMNIDVCDSGTIATCVCVCVMRVVHVCVGTVSCAD